MPSFQAINNLMLHNGDANNGPVVHITKSGTCFRRSYWSRRPAFPIVVTSIRSGYHVLNFVVTALAGEAQQVHGSGMVAAVHIVA